jgi:hypothetical protein
MMNLEKCLIFSIVLCSICVILLICYTIFDIDLFYDLGITLIGSWVVSLFFAFVFLDLNPLRKIFFG